MKKIDILGAVFVNFIIGTTFTVGGYSLLYFAPIFLYGIRLFSAGTLTISFNKLPIKYLGKILTISFLQAINFGGMVLGIKNIDSSTSAIFTRLDIVFTILLGAVLFKEKLSFRVIIGVIICFSAVIYLSGGIQSDKMVYIFIMIISAISNALANIIIKTIHDLNSKTITSWSLFFAGIILISVAVFFEYPLTLKPIDYKIILAICYMGVFASYVTFIIFYHLLKKYDTHKVMPYNFLIPIVSIIFGNIFLSEPITLRKIIGVALVIFGIYVSQYKKPSKNILIRIKDYIYKKPDNNIDLTLME